MTWQWAGKRAMPRVLTVLLLSFGVLVSAIAGCGKPGHVLADPTTAATTAATTPTTTTSLPSISYDQSCETTAMTQSAMDACASSELSDLQNQLSAALQTESTLFPSSSVNSVQSDWSTFVNTECTMEANSYQGGSIYPMIFGDCEVQLTVTRIEEVRKLISSLEERK